MRLNTTVTLIRVYSERKQWLSFEETDKKKGGKKAATVYNRAGKRRQKGGNTLQRGNSFFSGNQKVNSAVKLVDSYSFFIVFILFLHKKSNFKKLTFLGKTW